MAAFPVQISSSLNPTVPDLEELQQILEILQIDPNSVLLETKITQLGFSRDVVDKLRRDPRFLEYTIESLQRRLERLREEHLEITTECYLDWVENGIVNDDLNFFSKLLISQQPEVIRRLESLWRLPLTGDLNSMLENYRRENYTRRCFHYGHSPNFCMMKSAHWGHKEIVEEALERGADNYNEAMKRAAQGGYKEIVQMMLDLGADDYNSSMVWAAHGGHKEIVQIMLNLGATDYDGAMLSASRGGQKEIVQMMLDLGANDYNWGMTGAIEGGHKEIVQMMLDRGANNYNEAMAQAARRGHMDIFQLMLDRGANNYNEAMEYAIGSRHKEIVELIRQYRDRKLS